jgi:tRNA(Ile)-lysidine synthase
VGRETVRQSIENESMLAEGMRIVVAVSGGADSVCLLHILASLREEFGIALVVAHLDHEFRGAESEEDAAFVAQLAQRLHIPAVVEKQDVPALRLRRHLSAQQAAREVRHAFLRRVMEEQNAARIALGHTRDDRVETVLGNVLRGTGLEGLAAMPPVDLPLIRPLCDLSRAETHAYCEQHRLPYRQDSSNENLHYRRNRMRLELLPFLRTYFNSDINAAILRMATLASADNFLLEQLAQDALRSCLDCQTPDALTLNSHLRELPLALQRRVLRQAILQVRGSLTDVGFDIIEKVLQMFAVRENLGINLPLHDGTSTRLVSTADIVTVERVRYAMQARKKHL